MQDWSWLNITGSNKKYSKGSTLFDQSDPVEQMFYLVSGRIKLVRHSSDGELSVLHVATAREMIAEASLFSERYHCRAVVDIPSEVCLFPRDQVLEKVLADQHDSRKVMALFARQIRDLRGLIEMRNIRSAQNRILAYLQNAADADGRVELRTSLLDIAYKLGLAHETFYRELRQLEHQGKLERIDRGVFRITK